MIWPRLLVAAALLSLPIWAGAAGRSLWSLLVIIPVFAIAYLDGRHRVARERFAEGSPTEQGKAIFGALVSQSVLVSILFFAAAGLSAALGALGERLPYGRLDAALTASALAVALLGGAAARWMDGGRDPVDRAIEKYGDGAAALRKAADRIEALQRDLGDPPTQAGAARRNLGDDDEANAAEAVEERIEGFRREAAALAQLEEEEPDPQRIFGLAERVVAGLDDVGEAATLLRAFAVWPRAPRYPGARQVRRAGFAGLFELTGDAEGLAVLETLDLGDAAAAALQGEDAIWVRFEALKLAEAIPLVHPDLAREARLILQSIDETLEQDAPYGAEAALRRQARRYLAQAGAQ